MLPTIKTITEKKLIGISILMSLTDNKTYELFSSFMPRRKEIKNTISTDVFDVIVYPKNYYKVFNPATNYKKWAMLEVSDFNDIPKGMETFTLESGLYAVFHYKGLHTDMSIFKYIFETWLPNADYLLDHRPHFEILGDNYKNNDPNSEEDIYIPIKLK